jgi:hypothetical protein
MVLAAYALTEPPRPLEKISPAQGLEQLLIERKQFEVWQLLQAPCQENGQPDPPASQAGSLSHRPINHCKTST